MPRIRTLKPEHKQHRKVGTLTDRQYRLWIGMITEADDEGRLVAEPAWLKAVIFPWQTDLTYDEVAQARDELRFSGLIRLYRVKNVMYAAFPSWSDHQRIDKPKPSFLPRDSVRDSSAKRRRHKDDASTMNPRGSGRIGKDQGSDRTGGEGKGGEPRPDGLSPGPELEPRDPALAEQTAAHRAIVAHVRATEPKPGLRDDLVRQLEREWVRDVRAGRVDPTAPWQPATANA